MITRISCDTNMLISAVHRPNGGSSRALKYIAGNAGVKLLIADYVERETLETIRRDRPHKEKDFVALMERLPHDTITLPDKNYQSALRISDLKDQPIMDIISANNIDIFITNDNHFLEQAHKTKRPEIMALHDFEDKYFSKICNRPLEVMMKRKDERKRSSEGKGGNYLVFDGSKTGRLANPQHPFVPRLIRTMSVRRVSRAPRNGKMIIAAMAK